MELITRRDVIMGHVEYMRRHSWSYSYELDRIDAIVNPTLEELDNAIQRHYLTRLHCDECNQEVESLVELGEEPADESNTARVCQDCLEKALALIKGEK
jgi:DNA-directed RNA polymerase subunit M/transcription elongation factor TFIIS